VARRAIPDKLDLALIVLANAGAIIDAKENWQ
jgi:hypothetical protein